MYYVIPLSRDEILQGTIFAIGVATAKAAEATAKLAQLAEVPGNTEEVEIFAEHLLTNPNFHKTYGPDILETLYVNEAAKDIFDKEGLKLNVQGTVDQIPRGTEVMLQTKRVVSGQAYSSSSGTGTAS